MASPDDLLTNPYYRRQYLGLGVVALVALALIRFLLLPQLFGEALPTPYGVLTDLADSFLVAVAASVATLGFLLWAVPPSVRSADVSIVPPAHLKQVLDSALAGTQEFWYRGHTARWTRAVTLPRLAAEARRERRSKRVYLIISDPGDRTVCEYYAGFAHHARPGDRSDAWDARRSQIELYGTIVSAYVWQAEEPLMDVNIALSDKASLFRVDLTSKAAIITTPHPRDPAVAYSAGGHLYGAVLEDLHVLYRQCRTLPKPVPAVRLEQLDARAVRSMLAGLGFDVEPLSPAEVDQIVAIARRPDNPYPH
jgi:hypothetical protein